jgi:hypothetical protein
MYRFKKIFEFATKYVLFSNSEHIHFTTIFTTTSVELKTIFTTLINSIAK